MQRRRTGCWGRIYFISGAHTAVVAACDRAASLRSDEYQCLVMGATAEARRWMQRARRRIEQRLADAPRSLRAICKLFCCHVESTRLRLLPQLRSSNDAIGYYVVGGLARAGETALALEQLEAVADGGWAHGAYLAQDPDLKPLRGVPRFRRLERRMIPA